MWERIQKFIDRIESRIALWQLARGAGVVTAGVLSGWFSSSVAMIDRFGAYGWFTAALIGALLAAAILALVAYSKRRMAEAKLLNLSTKQRPADAVNPLDREFHKQRISIQELAHPISRRVSHKSFTDCQLVGPASILFSGEGSLVGVSFGNCDFILTKRGTFVKNVIPFENVDMKGGEIMNCAIFVHPDGLDAIKKIPGIYFINQTGDAALDSRLPPGIGPRIQR